MATARTPIHDATTTEGAKTPTRLPRIVIRLRLPGMPRSLGSDEGQGAKVQPSCATTDAVPAACPIGQHNGVIHGHSRVHGHTARPAFELTHAPGPEVFQAGITRRLSQGREMMAGELRPLRIPVLRS